MRPGRGRASWEDWFQFAGYPKVEPRVVAYDTYSQVLAASAAGRGVALGWKYYADGYLDSGALVALSDGFVQFGGCCVAELTSKGQNNRLARQCLELLAHFA
ncbi:MAG: hypothetical protein OXQ29_22630 [Rhodospirillaceae bacterium]|nr:hypothetical protein [Rhodospirillaceae bacterium]